MFETEEVELFETAIKNDKIALIDADTVAYAACSVCEYVYYDSELGEDKYEINIEDALAHADEKIEQILNSTGCKEALPVFSIGTNFRYSVFPQYKANRTGRRPEGLVELKNMLIEKYKGLAIKGFEADDIVVYLKKKDPEKYILCAIDKDVLYAVPGKHFNYYSKLEAKNGPILPHFFEVTDIEALRHTYVQAISGDSSDGIPGVPGKGPVKAKKMLENINNEREMYDTVVKAFKQAGKSEVDALIHLRLVSMHQMVEDKYALEGFTLKLYVPPVTEGELKL